MLTAWGGVKALLHSVYDQPNADQNLRRGHYEPRNWLNRADR
jgi:hypothetical protein